MAQRTAARGLRGAVPAAWLAVSLAAGGCGGAGAAPAAPAGDLTVRRGDLRQRVLLTGELKAESGAPIVVPRTPSWQVTIRWMVEDGARVEAGDRVLELDNSSFAGELEEKRLAVSEAENRLDERQAAAAEEEADKLYQVEVKAAELRKTELDAAIPEELLSRREYQERQLALRRAQLELEKAREDLAAHREATAAELAELRLKLSAAERARDTAEAAIEALTVRSPRGGIAVVGEHPWHGRKLELGDSVWVGFTVMRVTDLESMTVSAALSDVDDGRLAVGDPVRMALDAFLQQPFTGRVTELGGIASEDAEGSLRRSFKVGIEPQGLDPQHMRPGMSVKVEAQREGPRDALLVPRAALDPAFDPPRARLADGSWAPVELGACSALECVVEEGLTEGTRLAAAEGPA